MERCSEMDELYSVILESSTSFFCMSCFARFVTICICPLLAWDGICRCLGQCDRELQNSPGTPGISCFHYPVLYRHPLTNVLFVCGTNSSYVVTYATEHIPTKAHHCLFSNQRKLWLVM